jgi:hypothetical protein
MIKSNLTDVFNDLKSILEDNLRKSGYRMEDITFDVLFKQI